MTAETQRIAELEAELQRARAGIANLANYIKEHSAAPATEDLREEFERLVTRVVDRRQSALATVQANLVHFLKHLGDPSQPVPLSDVASELRKHPGARAVVELLVDDRDMYMQSTSPTDREAQHFDGEWAAAAELCNKLIELLGGEQPAEPECGDA